MFQNMPDLRRSFLKVGVWSSLTGLLLTFLIRGSWFASYILIAITGVSIIVLFFLVLSLILVLIEQKNHDLLSKKEIKEMLIGFSYIILFLAIQYLLVGVIGNLIFRYDEHAAIKYCEQVVGKKAEEYKSLNGVYPNRNTLGLDEIHMPLMVSLIAAGGNGYSSSVDGDSASCEYKYPKQDDKAYKVYIIQDKEWDERSSR